MQALPDGIMRVADCHWLRLQGPVRPRLRMQALLPDGIMRFANRHWLRHQVQLPVGTVHATDVLTGVPFCCLPRQ